jgi:hypothetical protein
MVIVAEKVNELPDERLFLCTGPVFVVRLHADITTAEGHLVARAGLYEAQDSSPSEKEREITIWSPDYYARGEGNGGWVGLPDWQWSLPE